MRQSASTADTARSRGYAASIVLNRKDFGIDLDLRMETGGAVVGDKIAITLNIEAVKQG